MSDSNDDNLPYFNMPFSNGMTLNFDSIWFFKKTLHLSIPYKTTITKSLLQRRNWSVFLFIFQIVLGICKASLEVLNHGALAIIFNSIYILVSIFGLFGIIYIYMLPLLIYLMGALGTSIGFILVSVLVMGIGVEKEKAQAWWLYAPFIFDILVLVVQALLVIPIINWYAGVEKRVEDEQLVLVNNEGNGDFMNIFRGPNIQQLNKNSLNESIESDKITTEIELSGLIAKTSEEGAVHHKSHDTSSTNLVNHLEDVSHLCVICTLKRKEGTFYPCGHVACCQNCGQRFQGSDCPICRKKVIDYVKLYNA